MSDIVIERGISIPPFRPGPPIKYPFRNMKVGDSFFLVEKVLRVRGAANIHRRRHGGRFIVRKAEGGARCWRIA